MIKFIIILFFIPSLLFAISDTLLLPTPNKTGGKPLMEALALRKTDRTFSEQKLSNQELSNLLWAAFGINRPLDGKRTAPSALNRQEIDIYVVTNEAVYLYNAKLNALIFVKAGNFQKNMGKQEFVSEAAINIVYVSNFNKLSMSSKKNKMFYSSIDVGFISQNVYLFCASENLNTVVQAYIDRKLIAKIIKLDKSKKIILVQSVGFPKK